MIVYECRPGRVRTARDMRKWKRRAERGEIFGEGGGEEEKVEEGRNFWCGSAKKVPSRVPNSASVDCFPRLDYLLIRRRSFYPPNAMQPNERLAWLGLA